MSYSIVLFGGGESGEQAYKCILEETNIFDDSYVSFSDNDASKWGKDFLGLCIVSPVDIEIETISFVVICSIYYKAIRKQLIEELLFPDEKIISFELYKKMKWCEYQYKKRYSRISYSKNSFDVKKIVVYTAVMGGYDEIRDPEYVDPNITYVCFTNNKNSKSSIWNIEYVEDDSLDDLYFAKKFKLNPHKYFPEYETSIWIDGSFKVMSDLRGYIYKYGGEQPILCTHHSERECVYEEAAACINYHLCKTPRIIKQISSYYAERYPFNNGLYEMGFLVRSHNDETVKRLMKEWQEEIWKYSYRDQLSFPVVCWRNDFCPDISGVSCYANKWIKYYKHRIVNR